MKRKTVDKFWEFLDAADFDEFEKVMSEQAKVLLPNTSEVFENRAQYIEFNKVYPGRWHALVERLVETEYLIITVAKVSNEEGESHYVTSFFEFNEDNKICQITEYWGINTSPPTWRVSS